MSEHILQSTFGLKYTRCYTTKKKTQSIIEIKRKTWPSLVRQLVNSLISTCISKKLLEILKNTSDALWKYLLDQRFLDKRVIAFNRQKSDVGSFFAVLSQYLENRQKKNFDWWSNPYDNAGRLLHWSNRHMLHENIGIFFLTDPRNRWCISLHPIHK